MKLQQDEDRFDEWQAYFSYELLQVIKDGLERATLPPEQVRELTTRIGFDLACLIDASAPFAVEGMTITPVLTFSATGSDLDDGAVLLHQGSPSSLHEYVHGNADELFGG